MGLKTDLALSCPRTVGRTLCQQMELTLCGLPPCSLHTALEILNRQLMDQWPEVGPTCVVFKNWEHGDSPVGSALTVDLVTLPAC